MEINKLDLLKNVINAHSVKFFTFEEDCSEITDFDEGLRGQLYHDYDYGYIARQIKENCRQEKIYLIRDAFGVHYIILRAPARNQEMGSYVVIGPYIEEKERPDAVQIAGRMGLELYQVRVLNDYYYGIAATTGLEQVTHAMVRMLFTEIDWEIEKTGINLHTDSRDFQIRIQPENKLSMEIVEKRYACENKVLEAVSQGDAAKVELEMRDFAKYQIETRSSDQLREAKNSLIILNVLFRKAVEQAGVHPYYIDELSTSFAKRIEKAHNLLEITNINRDFVHKYCLLVKNYALKEYSDVVADCINYIEFNLTEELTLNTLAEQLNVNASSLSAKFKKETGCTLTDYINQRRVNASLILLVTTKLPVGEVAEKVGYINRNYYSRIFKKIEGMTPKEYRESMRGENEDIG